MRIRYLSLAILGMALLAACATSSASVLQSLPRPDDAKPVQISQGYNQGYATRMVEPEVFDLYAAWLADHGWQRQAPTEAYITLPHQLWRKDGLELLVALQPADDDGRTIVWLKITDLAAAP